LSAAPPCFVSADCVMERLNQLGDIDDANAAQYLKGVGKK
jgi:hypothetical protein